MHVCDNCGSPFAHSPLHGRPWPQQPPATYCCYGCLTWGEHRRIEKNASNTHQNDNTSIPRTLGVRLGISAIITAQIMIFGTAINLHNEMPEYQYNFISITILLLTIVVIILLGEILIVNTMKALVKKKITIEALFTITLLGSFIASCESYLTKNKYVYFEIIPILLIVYNIGNILVTHARSKAAEKIFGWSKQIEYAHKVSDRGLIVDVPVSTIEVNDIVQVGPGEMIPIDGKIIDGTTYVYTGYVCGEPFPVTRTVGDTVVAGEIVYDSVIKVQALSRGKQRQIDNIINIIEKVGKNSSSITYISDKLSRWFVPLIVIISIITFIYWKYNESYPWHIALYNSMSVLLVACPCVLGITAPLLRWLAINKMAENGIVVQSGDIIEKLAKIDCIVFDKTGTLTNPESCLANCISYVDRDKQKEILSALHFIEKNIRHPLAQMISQITMNHNSYDIYAYEIKSIPGCGIEAKLKINQEYMKIQIGSYEWIKLCIDDIYFDNLQEEEYKEKKIYVLCNGRLSMVINFQEKINNYAHDMLKELDFMNLKTIIMTGDNALRIDNLPVQQIYLGLSPIEKQRKLAEIKNNGHNILYIGDGINDAAALANADVAIAIASGVDLAIQVSDAILYNKDLRVIPWAIAYSRTIIFAIRRNLLRALIYNIVGVSLAACGYLHPILAILLMTLSSLFLILSSIFLDYNDSCLEINTKSNTKLFNNKYIYISLLYFITFVLQGIIITNLFDSNYRLYNYTFILFFIVLGSILSYIWYRLKKIPHYLDMVFGMLFFGNLGMVLGWWYDVNICGYEQCPCHLIDISMYQIVSGMNIGMLIFSNFSMFVLSRYPLHNRIHKFAMAIGGNIGMLYGMYIFKNIMYKYLSIIFHPVIGSYLSMSAGMIIGMLIGTYIIETLILTIKKFRYM